MESQKVNERARERERKMVLKNFSTYAAKSIGDMRYERGNLVVHMQTKLVVHFLHIQAYVHYYEYMQIFQITLGLIARDNLAF